MRVPTYVVVLFVAVAANLACSSTPPKVAHNYSDSGTSQAASRDTPSASEMALAQSVNGFGCDLYQKLRGTPGNLTFSPLSVSAAMGLTHAGASAKTRSEMQSVLHLPHKDEQAYEGYRSLFALLDAHAQAGGSRWTLANSIWAQQGAPLQPAFVRTIRESFRSEVDTLDFRRAPEIARETMNRWVEKKTVDKIRELFPPGSIDASTRLVLANAVYFKGRWATAFDLRGTRIEPFHLSTGVDKPTQMMSLVHLLGMASIAGAHILELPYRGERLSMLILLPDQVSGVSLLERRLNADSLRTWTSALHNHNVDVVLPRFTATSQLELAPTLAALGMPSAFDARQADFSGMTGHRDLSISLVVHKALTEVNEEGTEAAAATGVVTRTIGTSPMPDMFIADHPFVFFICDRASGCILFLGRVSDPTL